MRRQAVTLSLVTILLLTAGCAEIVYDAAKITAKTTYAAGKLVGKTVIAAGKLVTAPLRTGAKNEKDIPPIKDTKQAQA